MFFAYVAIGSTLVPILLFGITQAWRNLTLILLFVFLLNSFLFDLLSFLRLGTGLSNQALLNLYVYLECWLSLMIFAAYWRSRLVVSYALLALIVFTAVCSLLGIFAGRTSGVSWVENALEAVLVALVGIWSINRLMVHHRHHLISRQYFFWINLGLLTYFLGNLVIFIFKEWIMQNRPQLWMLHNIVHTGFNLLLSVGFIKWRKQMSSDSFLQPSL